MKIYLLNYRAPKYIKLKMLEIKWEVYRNTFVWRECDIPLSLPLAGKRLKICKYIDKLKKPQHSYIKIKIFFSLPWKIDNILSYARPHE